MNSQGSNGMPPMGMPPLGFGVVMPQPVGSIPLPRISNINQVLLPESSKTWQHQQILLPQQQASVLSDGRTNMSVYPQPYFSNTQQQQQWLIQQQKLSHDQKVLYEKLKKQQQFNEQKQRLKDFSSIKCKGTNSADLMIQNILSKDETAPRPSSNKRELIFSTNEAEERNTTPMVLPPLSFGQTSNFLPASYQPPQKNLHSARLPLHASMMPSGSSVLHSSIPYSNTGGQGQLCSTIYNSAEPSTPIVFSVAETSDIYKPQQYKSGSANHLISNSNPRSEKPPLQLPDWLSDFSNIPEVYKKACGLVQSNDEWVDTSRAYMLLMRTNVPPHFLGILWEMVNRNEPGRLLTSEFCGLLALVALIQNGKSFNDADILKSVEFPVFPLIDHPALLILSQDEIKKQQLLLDHSSSPPSQFSKVTPAPGTFPEDDEFDEFVCAAAPPLFKSENEIKKTPSPIPCSIAEGLAITSLASQASVPVMHKSKCKSVDQERSLNFPSLGNSPQNHHNKGIETKKDTEEFCDFQSASITSEEFISMGTTCKTIDNIEADKYAVFRDFTSNESDLNVTKIEKIEYNDDNFGEFHCSAQNMAENISSLNLVNTITNVAKDENIFDILENSDSQNGFESQENNLFNPKFPSIPDSSISSWAKDPFGEFDVSLKANSFPTDFSSDSSQYLTANASTHDSADTSSDPDDDFGDFVGSSGIAKETTSTSGVHSVSGHSELPSETQSVASLELPGLEMTVNLSTEGFKIQQTVKDEETELENQFKSLAFSSIHIAGPGEKIVNQSAANDLSFATIVSQEVSQHANKYCIIREEEQKINFDEPHIDPWKKCLRGCSKLFSDGLTILKNIKDSSLLTQVLETSQMQEYLLNLFNVNEVKMRIQTSSQNVTTNHEIQELLKENQEYWNSIVAIVGESLFKKDNTYLEWKEATEGSYCSLCLMSGGANLLHGGFSYHPPCANLWLNVIDLTLPSLIRKGSYL